jgi:preprotein translocase subunit SecY
VATSAAQIAKTGKFGDLRRRLVFLLLALVVYRIGAHIPVPGIDPAQLQQLFSGQQGGILNLFNMFSGGALSRFTVFALGIMPYISASIIMQLMTLRAARLRAVEERRRSWPPEDHAVHALWDPGSGPVPVAGYCSSP